MVAGQNCEPGVCANILGTIYNAEIDGCAWADEIPGCGVEDLGFYTNCDGVSSHGLKSVDFDFPNGQIQRLHGENRFPDQYFVVCIPKVTEDDLQLFREAREKYGRMVHLVANGPLVPRVLGCPGTMVFDPTYSRCVDDELRAKLREEFEREALWRATSTTPAPTTTTTTTVKPEPV